ncbi:hypothetical protein EVAR_82562_1 [Eumeta japonica]|uniref:Uncharacterized protein n=1 Tax=Eumeta variegata TaxID=151549 RepID=A0A4C1UX60_EUMVA|nr:hypothetical protein EVAR_82562_1 [Eumeta japonica]
MKGKAPSIRATAIICVLIVPSTTLIVGPDVQEGRVNPLLSSAEIAVGGARAAVHQFRVELDSVQDAVGEPVRRSPGSHVNGVRLVNKTFLCIAHRGLSVQNGFVNSAKFARHRVLTREKSRHSNQPGGKPITAAPSAAGVYLAARRAEGREGAPMDDLKPPKITRDNSTKGQLDEGKSQSGR